MTLNPRLWLGSVELTDNPYSFEFGGDFGNAQNVATILTSLLYDGEIESLNRRSNRTIVLPVVIEGGNLAQLDAAEAALVAEMDRQQNTLTFDPGDGVGETRAFDTFAAQAERVYDDDMETALLRRWRLTIKALPFRRSQTLVVDDAGTPPSGGGALLDNCESTTGWSSANGTTPAVDSVIFTEGTGSLRTRTLVTTGTVFWGSVISGGESLDTVTGKSLDTDTGGYLSVAIRTDWTESYPALGTVSGLKQLHMQVGGAWVEVEEFVAARQDDAGFVHYVWLVEGGLTVTGLRFLVGQYSAGERSGPAYVRYDDIELLPSATTDHQIVKQHFVQGSARTTGSLRVAAPSESVALGKVLAITVPTSAIPDGFQPDGERWVTQGTTTPDVTALAGHYYTPDASSYLATTGKPIFDVPVSMLTPGPYTMVALVKVESSPLVAGVQAQLLVDGTLVGPTSVAEVSIPGLANGWTFVPLGTAYLPPLPMQNADDTAKVRLLFKGTKMANVYMVPSWQVGGYPVADFSIVDCGSGTVEPGGASSSLFIDSPSIANEGLGGLYRGPAADRSNAQVVDAEEAWVTGQHVFNPGALTHFLVSLGAAGPTSTLTYFPRYL